MFELREYAKKENLNIVREVVKSKAFLQAEGGIRDVAVTGVQTCALPICRGWRQEGLLRMLENTLSNGERPEELIIYGGSGKVARNWESFHAIVAALKKLADDETLVIQSGKPVAVFRTSETSPRVLTANTNLVGKWATWDHYRTLEAKGLMMYGQYTAGTWAYIGTQGILQGTYETFAACGKRL